MRKVICSMSVSPGGFIAGSRGEIDWSELDEELHRFHNQRARELGALRGPVRGAQPSAAPTRGPAATTSGAAAAAYGSKCAAKRPARSCAAAS